MKAIFAICLVLAFACAQSTFVPEYQICQEGAGWSTKNISLDAAPVAGQNSTFTLCGENSDWYTVHFEKVHVTSDSGLDLTIPLNEVYINWGATGCYDVNFQIPEGHNELNVHFGSQFLHAPNFGCVDVTLKLEGNKNKFLAF